MEQLYLGQQKVIDIQENGARVVITLEDKEVQVMSKAFFEFLSSKEPRSKDDIDELRVPFLAHQLYQTYLEHNGGVESELGEVARRFINIINVDYETKKSKLFQKKEISKGVYEQVNISDIQP